MFEELKKASIKNIFIFVSDSLRYDFLPDEIAEMGLLFKTVSSSLYTASSFASIVSGLYPPRHGVYSWNEILPEKDRGLLTLEGYNFSLWCETTWTHLPPDDSQIHRILGNPKGIPLEEIKTPFIFIEDDKGGHCPYGLSFGEFMGGGCPDFFKEFGQRGRDKLINQYNLGVKKSIENFKRRLKIIEDRHLSKETIIIFTSDHGELLGEYGGLTSHGEFACPEIVYVPTVFIHPDLSAKKIEKTVLRHVDFLPTIIDLIGHKKVSNKDGKSLVERKGAFKYGLNFRFGGYYNSSYWKKIFSLNTCSIWDYFGGLSINRMGLKALFIYFYKIIKKHSSFNFMYAANKKYKYFVRIKNIFTAYRYLTKKLLVYNRPHFNQKWGKRRIKNYLKNINKHNHRGISLDAVTASILKDMGYMD